jgi:hypothetical protein
MSFTMGAYSLARAIPYVFLFVLAAFSQQPSAPRQPRSTILADVARDELISDLALGKQRVTVAHGILLVDLSPAVPVNAIGRNDQFGLPLEAMVRAFALQRDFNKLFPKDTFWVEPVRSMETAARRTIDQGGVTDETSRVKFQTTIQASVDRLAVSMRAAAAKKHLDLQTSRDPARGFQVKIVIRPPTARVRYMRFLTYEECQKVPSTAEGRTDCMREQWNDLNEGTVSLIGRYRYLAGWGKDFGGDEEGTFSITADSVVTLHPPGTGKDYGK